MLGYLSELTPHLLEIQSILKALFKNLYEYKKGAGSIRTYQLCSLRSITDVFIEEEK